MFCSFCIVPQTRGREISRRADAILDEARELADRGIREITLLGQTVNAYGRHDVRRSSAERAGTMAFSKLLRQLDTIPGLERIRYTSPHPIFFDEDLIRAHGELKKLCPHVHLPVQSGSDRTLARMRRRYTREDYLRIVADLREARSDIAITTDVIVGFPGETEADFERTLSLIPEAGFVDHFSFKYSPRPGTPAARLSTEAVIPAQEAQQRLEALQQLQRSQTLAYHRSRVGIPTEILLDGPSRRGGGQLCGRDPYLRVVNLHPPDHPGWAPKPGDLLPVEIVEATPHSLIGTAKSPSA
jgi:tRNA-2-methylthio-N6-dimethylallyladenosine synthase